MDWLTKHRLLLYYFTHKVRVNSPGQPSVVFHGKKQGLACYLVLAIEATKLLQWACEAYLAWVQNTQMTPKHRVQAPRVVRKFMDVFSPELPNLLPSQEVNFFIELVLGTATISIFPYRMAPAKLRELKI